MNVTQKGIITLIKSAVDGQKYPLPDGFSLEEAMPLIKRHHITALACEGAALCGIDVRDGQMQKLFGYYCKNLQISERQMRALEKVFAGFEARGIDYMPLKGCKLKALYPKPELRSMGDADVLIRMEQYHLCREVLLSCGFEEKGETDHELPWQSSRLYLELHKRVIPSYNKDFFAYYGDGWQLATVKEGCRYSMAAEDEWIYLITHFAKHCRDGGIGCRHVTDLWLYRKSHPGLREDYIRQELEKLQLAGFYENVLRLLKVWFGVRKCDGKMEVLTQYIFASGSWGEGSSRVLSQTLRDAQHIKIPFQGKITYAFKTLFPDVLTLRTKYTVLQKAPWMLPVVWVVRPFYKVLFEWKTLDRQKKNLRAVGKREMDERRRLLEYIDLNYNF